MILLNLERMRQQAGKFEARHLIVNIPAQEAKVIDNGKVAFWSKAIVGKIDRKTPTLDSVIKLGEVQSRMERAGQDRLQRRGAPRPGRSELPDFEGLPPL